VALEKPFMLLVKIEHVNTFRWADNFS